MSDRAVLIDLYRAGLNAADPRTAVAAALEQPRSGVALVAVGKAAVAMGAGAHDLIGDRISQAWVLTKAGSDTGSLPQHWQIFTAGHPIPDQRGFDATNSILEGVSGLDPEMPVICLISGGGSALLESPYPPISLSDYANLTSQMLRAGAPIQDLNIVRRAISQVKAGGLRRWMATDQVSTLVVSDVLSNDPAIIASGPTWPVPASRQAAIQLLDQYGLAPTIPQSIPAVLQRDESQPIADSHSGDSFHIIASNDQSVEAVIARGQSLGYRVEDPWHRQEGEAAELGRTWIDLLSEADPATGLLVGGGEATVTVKGSGIGGRNTEFALAAALRLEELGLDDLIVASLASDGDDAGTGAAGAIVDAGTAKRIRLAGIDPTAALANNDSASALAAADCLLITGPSGTNVADFYLALRRSR